MLVTIEPRLQGCLFLYNRSGNSVGEPRLLWVIYVDCFLVFALILCVVSCLGSCLEWCLKTFKIFLLFENFIHVRGLLLYIVAYRGLRTKVAL